MKVVYSSDATMLARLSQAIDDLVGGLWMWRTWGVLAVNDISQRYRRSKIGQFWITIGMATTMIGTSIVFSTVLNQPIENYLPFLGVGIVVWGLITGFINDLASAFIANGPYLQSYGGPRSVMLYRVIARNLIQFAHNLLIVPGLWIVFPVGINWATLLFVPAMVLCILNAFWIGLLVAPLSARFRDLPQIFLQLTSLMFFFTPIMYRPSDLRNRLPAITDFNPFYYFVEILRSPLLGKAPETHLWAVALGITVLGYAIAIPFYARFRGRINYWV